MRILAFDTAAGACSVGLWQGEPGEAGDMPARRAELRRHGHAEVLMPMIQAVTAEAGIGLSAVDRFAVTIGPGAFTGLRIGLATARGLALATGRPLVGMSSLAAIAAGTALPPGAICLAAVDSRREEVFVQLFGTGGIALTAPALLAPDGVQALLPAGRAVVVAGDGAAALRAVLKHEAGLVFAEGTGTADPADLARYAAVTVPGPAAAVGPLYLRAPDAVPAAGAMAGA